MSKDQSHAHNYPGRETPAVEKVTQAAHCADCLNSAKSDHIGVSADGSHKHLPKGKSSGKLEATPKSIIHDAAELAAGRTNSIGVSADGSHKGFSKK